MRKASEGRSFVRPCRSGMSGTVRDMLSGRVEGHTAGEYRSRLYRLAAVGASRALVGVMPSTPAEDGPCTSPT